MVSFNAKVCLGLGLIGVPDLGCGSYVVLSSALLNPPQLCLKLRTKFIQYLGEKSVSKTERSQDQDPKVASRRSQTLSVSGAEPWHRIARAVFLDSFGVLPFLELVFWS